jgi:hypothetical protein
MKLRNTRRRFPGQAVDIPRGEAHQRIDVWRNRMTNDVGRAASWIGLDPPFEVKPIGAFTLHNSGLRVYRALSARRIPVTRVLFDVEVNSGRVHRGMAESLAR